MYQTSPNVLMISSHMKVSSRDPRVVRDLCDKVLLGSLFGFLQVDIHIPNELLEKFREFSPLFVIAEVPSNQIPLHM